MGMTEYLVQLVKFCVLDAAIINGNSLEDCIGKVTKKVTLNGVSNMIETTIDDSDISRYYAEKSSYVAITL